MARQTSRRRGASDEVESAPRPRSELRGPSEVACGALALRRRVVELRTRWQRCVPRGQQRHRARIRVAIEAGGGLPGRAQRRVEFLRRLPRQRRRW